MVFQQVSLFFQASFPIIFCPLWQQLSFIPQFISLLLLNTSIMIMILLIFHPLFEQPTLILYLQSYFIANLQSSRLQSCFSISPLLFSIAKILCNLHRGFQVYTLLPQIYVPKFQGKPRQALLFQL